MKKFLILFLLFCSPVFADTITMPQYNTGGTVTAVNQNNRFNLLTNLVNGALNNENADVDGGFRFIEVLASLPSPGNQGRVVFLTADNTLNFDTGLTFLATALLANTQTFTGVNTFSGNTIFNGTLDANSTTTLAGATTISGVLNATNDVTLGAGSGDQLTINMNDGITYTPGATWTFASDQTVSGSWANLGTVNTANIDGGTLDKVQIGGATVTGTIFYNDSNDNATIIVPGATGTVLTSRGTTAIPAWQAPNVVIFT